MPSGANEASMSKTDVPIVFSTLDKPETRIVRKFTVFYCAGPCSILRRAASYRIFVQVDKTTEDKKIGARKKTTEDRTTEDKDKKKDSKKSTTPKKKTVEDKTTEDKEKKKDDKKATTPRKKTVEDRTSEDKEKKKDDKKATTPRKKTVEDRTSEDKEKKKDDKKATTPRKKTVEDMSTEDKEKMMDGSKSPATRQQSSCEPLFGSKETTKEIFSRENISKDKTFEYEEDDVRALEQDAVDGSMISIPDITDAPEYSCRDAEGEASQKPNKRETLHKMLLRVIKNLTKKKYVCNQYPFKYNDITKTIKIVKSLMVKEPVVMTCKAPAVLVGDLHGQYADLLRIFDAFSKDGLPGYYTSRYVFLGDYVDRGKQSLEVLMLTFWLKILHPTQIILLRGNHEFRAINRTYGFYAELQARFPSSVYPDLLFEQFNDLFMHYPLCCFVASNIMCMHGGISSKMKTRDELLKIPKPLRDSKDHPLACDLMWADPMIGLKGEKRNNVRGVSVYFGEDQLEKTMEDLGIKLVVRGHQMMQNGFNFFSNFKLVTIFSASSYYPDKPNKGAVLYVTKEGRVGFKSFAPLPKNHPANQRDKVFEMSEADGGHAVFKADATKK